MKLFEQYNIDIGYVVMGMAGVILIMLILLIVTMAKNASMRKKYKIFMNGENGKNMEKAILDKFAAIDFLEENVDQIYKQIKAISGQLTTAYQKIGLVKYDAFKEMGGKLSFTLALLDENNNGFLMNSVHSSDGCYSYTKRVKNGDSEIALSNEEKVAIERAMKGTASNPDAE